MLPVDDIGNPFSVKVQPLSDAVDEEVLTARFSLYGNIAAVHIRYMDGQRIGYVDYTSPASAVAAQANPPTSFGGENIVVLPDDRKVLTAARPRWEVEAEALAGAEPAAKRMRLPLGSVAVANFPPQSSEVSGRQSMPDHGEGGDRVANGTPTRVIFVRYTPVGASDSDLITLGLPFGTIDKVLLLNSKNIGFIQFAEQVSATAFVEHFKDHTPVMCGSEVHVKYSDRTEITSTSASVRNSPLWRQAVWQAEQYHKALAEQSLPSGPVGAEGTAAPAAAPAVKEKPKPRVLTVTLQNATLPSTPTGNIPDDLRPTFLPYGHVERISLVAGGNRALVQFTKGEHAEAALALDKHQTGWCTFQIQPSKQPQLTFTRPDERNRDYGPPAPEPQVVPQGYGMWPGWDPNQAAVGGYPPPVAPYVDPNMAAYGGWPYPYAPYGVQ